MRRRALALGLVLATAVAGCIPAQPAEARPTRPAPAIAPAQTGVIPRWTCTQSLASTAHGMTAATRLETWTTYCTGASALAIRVLEVDIATGATVHVWIGQLQ